MTQEASNYDMKSVAEQYARKGWKVLPCKEKGTKAKAPYLKHGFKDASDDPQTVSRWWNKYPGALIGIVVPPDCVVFDIDPRSMEGKPSKPSEIKKALEAIAGPLPKTLTAISGRADGGVHLYYLARLPRSRRWCGQVMAGVDVRAAGKAYLIAPPSPHPLTGKPYEWVEASRQAVELPPAAIAAATYPLEGHRTGLEGPNGSGMYSGKGWTILGPSAGLQESRLDGMVKKLSAEPPGNRNRLLFRFACEVCRDFQNPRERLQALSDAASAAGLEDAEVSTVIRSAVKSVFGEVSEDV